jgi:hypothetical protein
MADLRRIFCLEQMAYLSIPSKNEFIILYQFQANLMILTHLMITLQRRKELCEDSRSESVAYMSCCLSPYCYMRFMRPCGLLQFHAVSSVLFPLDLYSYAVVACYATEYTIQIV